MNKTKGKIHFTNAFTHIPEVIPKYTLLSIVFGCRISTGNSSSDNQQNAP